LNSPHVLELGPQLIANVLSSDQTAQQKRAGMNLQRLEFPLQRRAISRLPISLVVYLTEIIRLSLRQNQHSILGTERGRGAFTLPQSVPVAAGKPEETSY
jgi:hypothetical protein